MPVIRDSQRKIDLIETSTSAVNREEWISEPGNLTQFGALIHVLQPGTKSSIKHWHKSEDEFVYVLSGQITLIEGDESHNLLPGDAATFPHGVAAGHYLENKTMSIATCLVVGTRATADQITYPDCDRILHRDRSLPDDIWTDLSGNPAMSPYKAWLP